MNVIQADHPLGGVIHHNIPLRLFADQNPLQVRYFEPKDINLVGNDLATIERAALNLIMTQIDPWVVQENKLDDVKRRPFWTQSGENPVFDFGYGIVSRPQGYVRRFLDWYGCDDPRTGLFYHLTMNQMSSKIAMASMRALGNNVVLGPGVAQFLYGSPGFIRYDAVRVPMSTLTFIGQLIRTWDCKMSVYVSDTIPTNTAIVSWVGNNDADAGLIIHHGNKWSLYAGDDSYRPWRNYYQHVRFDLPELDLFP